MLKDLGGPGLSQDDEGASLEGPGAESYPPLDMGADEVRECLRTWMTRDPRADGFDPVKVLGTDDDDMPRARMIERMDLFLAAVPIFAERQLARQLVFKYVKFHELPAAVEWVRGSPRGAQGAQAAAASGDGPQWDPDDPQETRDVCDGPWIALKLAFARRNGAALGRARELVAAARETVGKSVRARLHEAIGGSAKMVRALAEIGCAGDGFPDADELYQVLRSRASSKRTAGGALGRAGEACRLWGELEDHSAALEGKIGRAAGMRGSGRGGVSSAAGNSSAASAALQELSEADLAAFTELSQRRFDDCMSALKSALESAATGTEALLSVDVSAERAAWERMLDLTAPDPGVADGYRSLETFARESGDELAAMGADEAERECRERFGAYLALLNAWVYSADYVHRARENVNRLYFNKEVAMRFWGVYFNDIVQAYLMKWRPKGTPVRPHVSELGTVYRGESILEYTIAFWDFPLLMKNTKKYFKELFMKSMEPCRALFGWTRKATDAEFAEAGYTGAIHPSTYVLIAEVDGGLKKRMRLAGDGSVTFEEATGQAASPLRRSDHFIVKEIDSNVFIILSYDGLQRAFVSGLTRPEVKFTKNTNRVSEESARFRGWLEAVDPEMGRNLSLTLTRSPLFNLKVWMRPLSLIRWLTDTDDRLSAGIMSDFDDASRDEDLESSWFDKRVCEGKTFGGFNKLMTRLSCAQKCANDPRCKYAIQGRQKVDWAECRLKSECGKEGVVVNDSWNTWVKPAKRE